MIDDDYSDYDDGACPECDGEGLRLTCVDDICRGLGYCMHDSGGYGTCQLCKGTGWRREGNAMTLTPIIENRSKNLVEAIERVLAHSTLVGRSEDGGQILEHWELPVWTKEHLRPHGIRVDRVMGHGELSL